MRPREASVCYHHQRKSCLLMGALLKRKDPQNQASSNEAGLETKHGHQRSPSTSTNTVFLTNRCGCRCGTKAGTSLPRSGPIWIGKAKCCQLDLKSRKWSAILVR